MPSPSLPRPKTMMFVSALLCVVLVPLVYATVNRNEEHRQHFDEIAKMTESDRRQLEHNFKTFQQLSPEQQEEFRRLHSQLNGEFRALKGVLDEYHEFLRSLDPVDRSDIERESKFLEKMHAIRTVVGRLNDESQRQQELLQESYAHNQRSPNSDGRRGPTPLTPEEIESLTRVLESHPNLTTVPQRTQLEPLRGMDRLAKLLSLVLGANGGSESKPFFSSQLTNELIAALSEERKKYFQFSREKRETERRNFEKQVKAGEADPDRPPWFLRRTLEEHHEMILIGTCLYTFNQALNDSAPSPEKMPEFLKELPPDVRDDLLNEDSGRLYEKLVKEYYRRKPTPLSSATKIIQEQAKKRFPQQPPRGRSGSTGGRSGAGSGRSGGDREPPRESRRDNPDGRPERDRPRDADSSIRGRNLREEGRDASQANESDALSFE